MEDMVQGTSAEVSAPIAHEAAPVEQKETAPQPVKETDQAQNFRALKKAAELAAQQRDELAQKLAAYEQANKPSTPDEDFNIKEDDLVEGKQLVKAFKRIKQLEEQQKQYFQQSSQESAEIRLKSQYPDFDKVVTLDNVNTFSLAYPELAKSINAASSLYDKGVSAYTLLKKFGIYQDNPYESEKNRAEANMAKPRPLASVAPQEGDSPMSRANAFANGLTDELRAQLRKEMEEARKLY